MFNYFPFPINEKMFQFQHFVAKQKKHISSFQETIIENNNNNHFYSWKQ